MECLGSDEFSGSSLQPCNSLLYKHQHIVFQSGSIFVKTPVCLEVFSYGKQQTEDLGSAGRQRDNLALLLGVCPSSLLLDGLLTGILLPSLAPLCLLADELNLSKLFFCSWKNAHLQIQLFKNPVLGCKKHFKFFGYV